MNSTKVFEFEGPMHRNRVNELNVGSQGVPYELVEVTQTFGISIGNFPHLA